MVVLHVLLLSVMVSVKLAITELFAAAKLAYTVMVSPG